MKFDLSTPTPVFYCACTFFSIPNSRHSGKLKNPAHSFPMLNFFPLAVEPKKVERGKEELRTKLSGLGRKPVSPKSLAAQS